MIIEIIGEHYPGFKIILFLTNAKTYLFKEQKL